MQITKFNNKGKKDKTKTEWLTPQYILKALGTFDLDPCAPIVRPWEMATKHYTTLDDGLLQDWDGRVWLNPPYGAGSEKWLKRLVEHGNGIALIYARTEIKMWFDSIWYNADALLFIKGRVDFYHVTGEKGVSNSGAPSVLVAYGQNNADCLRNCSIVGRYINLKDN